VAWVNKFLISDLGRIRLPILFDVRGMLHEIAPCAPAGWRRGRRSPDALQGFAASAWSRAPGGRTSVGKGSTLIRVRRGCWYVDRHRGSDTRSGRGLWNDQPQHDRHEERGEAVPSFFRRSRGASPRAPRRTAGALTRVVGAGREPEQGPPERGRGGSRRGSKQAPKGQKRRIVLTPRPAGQTRRAPAAAARAVRAGRERAGVAWPGRPSARPQPARAALSLASSARISPSPRSPLQRRNW